MSAATTNRHFGRPQDVAFLPDGRVLVADGLMNTRVVVLDARGAYLTEFGTKGTGPGQFMTVHGITTAPDGTVFVVDRDGRQVQLFRESPGAKSNFASAAVWKGFELPLDVVVSGNECLGVRPREAQGDQVRSGRQPTVHLVLAYRRSRPVPRDAHHECRLRRQSLWQRQPGRTHAKTRAEEGRRSKAVDQAIAAGESASPETKVALQAARRSLLCRTSLPGGSS